MAISFSGISQKQLPNRNVLKRFLQEIIQFEDFSPGNLHFQFCSQEEILTANKEFLNHNYLTDIITFDLSDEGTIISGDVLISPDVVIKNSIDYKSSFTHELHRVIFHGVLHLCGYGDKTEEEQKTMRSKEDFYLARYFNHI